MISGVSNIMRTWVPPRHVAPSGASAHSEQSLLHRVRSCTTPSCKPGTVIHSFTHSTIHSFIHGSAHARGGSSDGSTMHRLAGDTLRKANLSVVASSRLRMAGKQKPSRVQPGRTLGQHRFGYMVGFETRSHAETKCEQAANHNSSQR